MKSCNNFVWSTWVSCLIFLFLVAFDTGLFVSNFGILVGLGADDPSFWLKFNEEMFEFPWPLISLIGYKYGWLVDIPTPNGRSLCFFLVENEWCVVIRGSHIFLDCEGPSALRKCEEPDTLGKFLECDWYICSWNSWFETFESDKKETWCVFPDHFDESKEMTCNIAISG